MTRVLLRGKFQPMKKFLFVILVLSIAVFFYFLSKGAFSHVTVHEEEMPGYSIMALTHSGPYEKIGGSFERIQKIADQQGVPVKMIGVYFDNPDLVPADSLRSLAGIRVNPADSLKMASIEGVAPHVIPPGRAAVVTFETDGMVSMILGAIKSYPALSEYMAASGKAASITYVYEVYEEGATKYVMQYE